MIAAVLGLGSLSAYLVEENLEELTLERSANQRDTSTYLDDNRTLNDEHREIRRAVATAEQIIEEAVTADPDDPRFPTWGHWARHFDAKCRRMSLSFSHMDDFTVTSLFLPPLWDWRTHRNKSWYRENPSKVDEPLDSAELSQADTTPYQDQSDDQADAAKVLELSARKKIVTSKWLPNASHSVEAEILGHGTTHKGLHQGAVAWCYLPRSVSATQADGTFDQDNFLLRAARAYAAAVPIDAINDDPEHPGDKLLPGTWQNWEDHWTAKCLRTLEVFSDLKGFTVEADFTRPRGAESESLIFDRLLGGNARYPHKLNQMKLKPKNQGEQPRVAGTAYCEVEAGVTPESAPPAGPSARRRWDLGLATIEWLIVVAVSALMAALVLAHVQRNLDRSVTQVAESSDAGGSRLARAQALADELANRVQVQSLQYDNFDYRFQDPAFWSEHFSTRCARIREVFADLETEGVKVTVESDFRVDTTNQLLQQVEANDLGEVPWIYGNQYALDVIRRQGQEKARNPSRDQVPTFTVCQVFLSYEPTSYGLAP